MNSFSAKMCLKRRTKASSTVTGDLDGFMTKFGDKWWCNVCNKVMSRKDHMKNHVQIHFSHQEVICPICGFTCKNTPSLKVHISTCKKISGIPKEFLNC